MHRLTTHLMLAAAAVMVLSWPESTRAQERPESNDRQASALVEAVRSGDRSAVRGLLQSGASVNTLDARGSTALHYAVSKVSARPGTTDAYGLTVELLKHGADPTLRDGRGMTALARAIPTGSEALFEKLLEAGGDPNETLPIGLSLLSMAELIGNAGAAEAIRDAGGVHGSSPLEQAISVDLPRIGMFIQEARHHFARMHSSGAQQSAKEEEETLVSLAKRLLPDIFASHPQAEAALRESFQGESNERNCAGCDGQ